MNSTLEMLNNSTNFIIENAKQNRHNDNYCIFAVAFHNSPEIALGWLLYLRDKKDGLGQREAFRGLLVEIANHNVELAIKIFRANIVEFGRYDDELSIYDKVNTGCRGAIIDKVRYLLHEDLKLESEGKEISNLAKWMPSINTSSKHTRKLACMIMRDLLLSPRQYRKILSRLRKHLNVLERNLSKKEYFNINYAKISSKNDKKYNNLFLNNDYERRSEYIKKREKVSKMYQFLKENNQKNTENDKKSVEDIITTNRYQEVINEILQRDNTEKIVLDV